MSLFVKKLLLAILLSFTACVAVNAAEDNTKVNERDRAPGAVTADQQGQSQPDVDMTAKIRKAVVDDKTLSVNAHNVKVITLNGAVTLRGPVKTAAEKTAIGQKANEIAGEKNVKNDLEIVP